MSPSLMTDPEKSRYTLSPTLEHSLDFAHLWWDATAQPNATWKFQLQLLQLFLGYEVNNPSPIKLS